MDDTGLSNPFVLFVDQLFADPALERVFYHLQHKSGFNINILLYLLWMAKTRCGYLTRRHIKLLQDQVLLWHQRVVVELKYTHALLVDQTEPRFVQIKHELQNEIIKANRIEQCMLYDSKIKKPAFHRRESNRMRDACESIGAYCEIKNELLFGEDGFYLTQLCHAVFSDMSRDQIEKKMKSVLDQCRLSVGLPTQLMWEAL